MTISTTSPESKEKCLVLSRLEVLSSAPPYQCFSDSSDFIGFDGIHSISPITWQVKCDTDTSKLRRSPYTSSPLSASGFSLIHPLFVPNTGGFCIHPGLRWVYAHETKYEWCGWNGACVLFEWRGSSSYSFPSPFLIQMCCIFISLRFRISRYIHTSQPLASSLRSMCAARHSCLRRRPWLLDNNRRWYLVQLLIDR